MTQQPNERPGQALPLAGVVIADLTRVLAGPYATMLLADLGAMVIKIEPPGGDETRTWMPPLRDGESTYFLGVNRNKRSIALDFDDAGDLAIAHRIAERADVVVQNSLPGSLERFGLDPQTLRERRPELIYASISGFGAHGGAHLPGYDLLAQAASGLMDLTGDPESAPTKVGVAVADVITGLHASVGILAALHAREATGTGDHIEVNLLSSMLSGLVNQTSAFVAGGVVPHRLGNAHPSLTPYQPFPTADGSIVIAVGNDSQFARLCETLGMPELSANARFATMPARNAHRNILCDLLAQRTRTRGSQEWLGMLHAAAVPAGPILGIDGGLTLATELGLDPVAVAGSGDREIPTVRHPITYTTGDVRYPLPPPVLDGDRDAILQWLEEGSAH